MNDGSKMKMVVMVSPLQRALSFHLPAGGAAQASRVPVRGPPPRVRLYFSGASPPRSGFSASSIQLAGDLATIAGVSGWWPCWTVVRGDDVIGGLDLRHLSPGGHDNGHYRALDSWMKVLIFMFGGG